jgi:hypothetical protein
VVGGLDGDGADGCDGGPADGRLAGGLPERNSELVRYYQALDTFVAGLGDGTERLVSKGDPLPETHELVKRDLDALAADPGRAALFRPLGDGEPEPPRPRRAARGA